MFLDREWEQRNAEDELPQVWKLGIPVGEWWIERLLVQARWVTVVSSLSLLLLRPTVHWIWPLLLAAYYGIGNGIVHALIAPPKTFQDWKIGRTLAICIDWLGACFALLLFDASLTIGTTLFILLIGVTSLRSCTFGALGATFASGLVLLVCALHIWLIHDVPWNRLFPFLAGSLVTLAVAGTTFGLIARGLRRPLATLVPASEKISEDHAVAPSSGDAKEPLLADRRAVCWLTDRELEVLVLLAEPKLTYADIASQLDPPVSVHTVKTHVRRIAEKLGSERTRDEVVAAARRRGILHPEQPILIAPMVPRIEQPEIPLENR
ncbi:helix-turn-helix transcriptional regulator [Thermorudis peleae]|uniref:helix-turn-helix transcriptional regulator n=1 Tax=Thermorudis peleae TaxID=1382356 RepID=UPI00056DCA03|nr:helix-turn-helix transcriptional regulator [Thermorudis peleae]